MSPHKHGEHTPPPDFTLVSGVAATQLGRRASTGEKAPGDPWSCRRALVLPSLCAGRMEICAVRAIGPVQAGKPSSRRGFRSKREGWELGRKGHQATKLPVQKP